MNAITRIMCLIGFVIVLTCLLFLGFICLWFEFFCVFVV